MIIDLITGKEIIRMGAFNFQVVTDDYCINISEINCCYDPEWGDINLIYVGF